MESESVVPSGDIEKRVRFANIGNIGNIFSIECLNVCASFFR